MDNKTRLAQMQEVRSHPKTERESKEQIMNMITVDQETLMRMIAQAVEAEREACAKVCEEFARKWWKIHCDSNLHYSSTLKAHQDFCALQAAIRARGQA